MKVSIISATYNRAELLDRALYTYSKQTLPLEDWEYLIADDLSTDGTAEVIARWRGSMNLRVFNPATDLGKPKKPGEWRDGCALRNSLSTFATGKVLVATHPEIMIPPPALQIMYETCKDNPDAWVTAVPYWLPKGDLPAWKRDLHNLRTADGFYDPSWPTPVDAPGAVDYRNQNQERRDSWESEVFWAMSMAKWRWLGGFREFKQWGSVDMDFLSRRRTAGIPTVIAKDPDGPAPSGNLMVYHQWHESKRDMAAAMEGVQSTDYSTVDRMREQGGLYSIYNHGPRERSINGTLDGIMGDHLARYEWAKFFSNGKDVLDVPCGTGYGASILTNAKSYTGVDIDAESIEWARKHYAADNVQFSVGNMDFLSFYGDRCFDDNSFDRIYCFEGIEHCMHQEAFVDTLHALLRPGGSFIISTPQRGATHGTFWDKYMLTKEELAGLFCDARWTRLDWFYQPRYGAYQEPIPGRPPADAEIMILGGTAAK